MIASTIISWVICFTVVASKQLILSPFPNSFKLSNRHHHSKFSGQSIGFVNYYAYGSKDCSTNLYYQYSARTGICEVNEDNVNEDGTTGNIGSVMTTCTSGGNFVITQYSDIACSTVYDVISTKATDTCSSTTEANFFADGSSDFTPIFDFTEKYSTINSGKLTCSSSYPGVSISGNYMTSRYAL